MEYDMKKLLVVGVIILFLGLACAPSINANVSKESELVEITTKICGLGGGKHTVQLTKEEAEEVVRLFGHIRDRLDRSETQEESIDIFHWAISQINEKGLLPKGMNVEEIQALMTDKLIKNDWGKLVEKSSEHNIQPIDDNENRNCLIAGHTSFSLFVSYSTIPRFILLFLLAQIRFFRFKLMLYLMEKIHDLTNYSFPLLTFIYEKLHINIFLLDMYLSLFLGLALPFLLPIDIRGIITFGFSFTDPWYDTTYRPSEGWIYTNGQNGIIKWNDTFYGHLEEELIGFYVGATGYTGIKIWLPFNTFFLGFASKVKLDSTHP